MLQHLFLCTLEGSGRKGVGAGDIKDHIEVDKTIKHKQGRHTNVECASGKYTPYYLFG